MRRAAFAVLAMTAALSAAPTLAQGLRRSTDALAAPAGRYELDRPRSAVVGRINHLGLSELVFRFRTFDASYQFDPARPEATTLTATGDPGSIDMGYDDRFNEEIGGHEYLNAAAHAVVTFRSTRLVRTGPVTADAAGDLTLMGVTRPTTLHITFNGTQTGLEGETYMGFTARADVQRSAFGLTRYVGPIGDTVRIEVQAEFVRRP